MLGLVSVDIDLLKLSAACSLGYAWCTAKLAERQAKFEAKWRRRKFLEGSSCWLVRTSGAVLRLRLRLARKAWNLMRQVPQ